MKKYVFLVVDDQKHLCICEQCVEAYGMLDAFKQIQKITNQLSEEKHIPLKVELKGVQYVYALLEG